MTCKSQIIYGHFLDALSHHFIKFFSCPFLKLLITLKLVFYLRILCAGVRVCRHCSDPQPDHHRAHCQYWRQTHHGRGDSGDHRLQGGLCHAHADGDRPAGPGADLTRWCQRTWSWTNQQNYTKCSPQHPRWWWPIR